MPQVSKSLVSWNGVGQEFVTVCKWMKGLPANFPIIYAEVWVGGEGISIGQYFDFSSLSRRLLIFFPFPVAIYERHVTLI